MFEGGAGAGAAAGAGQGEAPAGRGRGRGSRHRGRCARRCRSSSGRGFKDLKAKERARLAPEEAKARERFIKAEGQRAGRRAPACRRTPRGPSSSASAKACCCRISCCRSTIPIWPAAPSATCWRTPIASRARPWRIRWRVSDYGRCCAKIMRRRRRHAVDPSVRPRPHHLRAQDTTRPTSARRSRRRQRTRWWRSIAAASVAADLDAVEAAALRQLAKKLSGINMPAIDATLAAAQQQHAAAQSQGLQAWQADQRQRPAAADPAAIARRAVAAADGGAERGDRCRGGFASRPAATSMAMR